MQPLGRTLILVGLVLVCAGLLFTYGGRLPLRIGRLPGDFVFRGKHSVFYFPLTTSFLFWLTGRR
jgi:hypothetical protein